MPSKRNLLRKEESLLSMTLSNAMESLFDLFVQAPTLGSLINTRSLSEDLYQSGYEALTPLLSEVLRAETNSETRERAIAAAGMVKAVGLLVDEYTLVVTNVPYLGRGKQNETLKSHLEKRFNEGKADLATAFVLRCIELCDRCGSVALVTQQNWWFLSTYRPLRQRFLTDHSWQLIVALGEEAWQSFGDRGPVAALSILASTRPDRRQAVAGIDALPKPDISQKIREMAPGEVRLLPQAALYDNPDHRITVELAAGGALLQRYAVALQGVSPADLQRFGRAFWEVCLAKEWRFWQGAVEETKLYGGRSLVLWWNQDLMDAVERGQAFIRGHLAWNKMGVACRQMRDLPVTIYGGELFDTNTAVIVPSDPAHLPALWCFCSSSAFLPAIRRIDKKVNVTNASFGKVPFDLAHWQVVARREYPGGLPEPESDDPTQWLFHGWPQESTAPLHVAVARLLGFRWPPESNREMHLSGRARALADRCDELSALTDSDGIICIRSVRGEEAASERLLGFLARAGVTSQQARELARDRDLDDWLQNVFFGEHVKMFDDRPFVWLIWDGRRRDGFHALINYHKLAEGNGKGHKLLENLTYSYLGDWISRQRDEVKRGEGGAEDRLAAALALQDRLKAILEGDPPFDLFVRWKPLADQPIGWEPDINDGVRINIRPFLARDLPNGRMGAGVLRHKPNIKWAKDRGKEPERPKAEYPWFWDWDEVTEDGSSHECMQGE